MAEENRTRHGEMPDMYLAVDELHSLSSGNLYYILRNSHSLTLRLTNVEGVTSRVDLERLAACLPRHLLACAAMDHPKRGLWYIAGGIRLLHSLADLASQVPRLEQTLLVEAQTREQILDLVFYLLIILANSQLGEHIAPGKKGVSALLQATVTASCLYLLPAYVSSEWVAIAPVLLVHPKVDIFMDTAVDCTRTEVEFLQSAMASLLHVGTGTADVAVVNGLAQQCEASLQTLRLLCSSGAFRDRMLRHKELCEGGGLLRLQLAVLQLRAPASPLVSRALSVTLSAAISRMKARALAILVLLCQAESVCFLEVVAGTPMSGLVVLEVLELLRKALLGDPEVSAGAFGEMESSRGCAPHGLLCVNTLRVANAMADDANFRPSVMNKMAPCLAEVLAAPPPEFMSRWGGGDLARTLAGREADAFVIYRPFHSLAAVFQLRGQGDSSSGNEMDGDMANEVELYRGLAPIQWQEEKMSEVAHAREMTLLLVHLLSNLNHAAAEDSRTLQFLPVFLDRLREGPLRAGHRRYFLTRAQTAVRICENLHMLVDFVAHLPWELAAEADLVRVSNFLEAVHAAICPQAPDHGGSMGGQDPHEAILRDGHDSKVQHWREQRGRQARWLQGQGGKLDGDEVQEADQGGGVRGGAAGEGGELERRMRPDRGRRDAGEEEEGEGRQLRAEDGCGDRDGARVGDGGKRGREEEGGLGIREQGKGLGEDSSPIRYQRREKQEWEEPIGRRAKTMGGEEKKLEREGEGGLAGAGKKQVGKELCGDEEGGQEEEGEGEEGEEEEEEGRERAQKRMRREEGQQGSGGVESKPRRRLKRRWTNDRRVRRRGATVEGNRGKVKPLDRITPKTGDSSGEGEEEPGIGPSRVKAVGVRAEEPGRRSRGLASPGARAGSRRRILTDAQEEAIEGALLDEPFMQRYPDLLEQWLGVINDMVEGSHVSLMQLKNWINNRKQRQGKFVLRRHLQQRSQGPLTAKRRRKRQLAQAEGEQEGRGRAGDTLEGPRHPTAAEKQCSSAEANGDGEGDADDEDDEDRNGGESQEGEEEYRGGEKKEHAEDDSDENEEGRASEPEGEELGERKAVGGEENEAAPSRRKGAGRAVRDRTRHEERGQAAGEGAEVAEKQAVLVLDEEGGVVGEGLVLRVQGRWKNLRLGKERCLIYLASLDIDADENVPFPTKPGGQTFLDCSDQDGRIMLVWHTSKLKVLPNGLSEGPCEEERGGRFEDGQENMEHQGQESRSGSSGEERDLEKPAKRGETQVKETIGRD